MLSVLSYKEGMCLSSVDQINRGGKPTRLVPNRDKAIFRQDALPRLR